MTRGEKFIQDMTAKGLDEEQLRKFVETGNCIGFLGLCCSDCPFKCRRCRDNAVIANYFKGEIEEETKMKASEIKEFPSARRNTLSEMREVIDAMESGKSIEFKYVGDSETARWFDNRNTPPDFINCVYRVKPEETKKNLRPFKTVQEFINAAGGLGAIWLKRKTERYAFQVNGIDYAVNATPICIDSAWLSFDNVFECYTFADGRPCGVEE